MNVSETVKITLGFIFSIFLMYAIKEFIVFLMNHYH